MTYSNLNNLNDGNNNTNVEVHVCLNEACPSNHARNRMKEIYSYFEKLELISSFRNENGKYIEYLISPMINEETGRDYYRSQYSINQIRAGARKWYKLYEILRYLVVKNYGHKLSKEVYMEKLSEIKLKLYALYSEYYALREKAEEPIGSAVILYSSDGEGQLCCPLCGESNIITEKGRPKSTFCTGDSVEDIYTISEGNFRYIYSSDVYNIDAASIYNDNGENEFSVLDVEDIDVESMYSTSTENNNYLARREQEKEEYKALKRESYIERLKAKDYLNTLHMSIRMDIELPQYVVAKVEEEPKPTYIGKTYGRKKGVKLPPKEYTSSNDLDELAWKCGF